MARKERRYNLITQQYVYARNNREAMVKAAKIAEKSREQHDNQRQVITLDETPFASCDSRNIRTGRLTIFKNKLIEA